MTEITDAEVREIQWASSEQGKAAVRAAHRKAVQIGAKVDMAEAGAIVYAAHLAAEAADISDEDVPEPEPAGCSHTWTILSVYEVPPLMVLIGKPMPRTAVLLRCEHCGEPASRVLEGAWTLEDLLKMEGQP